MPQGSERAVLEEALQQLEVQALNFGFSFIKNERARQFYVDNTQEFSNSIRAAYDAGLMSAEEGAKSAHEMRNQIMTLARQRNSQLGRAYSKSLKETGAALDDLANKYALRRFNKAFDELTQGEREQVFVEIMDAAGRPNPRVTKLARRLGKAGRVMWVFTAAVAYYNIYSAEDKTRAATREAATLGGGFAGGAAGGAIAGIWAGPVGVAIGIAVGGMLGAIIADEAFLEIAGPEQELARATLPKYTRMFSMDEQGLAKALYKDCGIAVHKVYAVFLELDNNYNSDADDVAYLYANLVKTGGNAVQQALKLHKPLNNLLIRILDDGWTTTEEHRTMQYLQYLRA